MIDIVAPDLRSLLVQASGARSRSGGGTTVKLELAGAAIHRLRMTTGQALLNALADPNIVYLLMLAGIVGIYFEFGHPGVLSAGRGGRDLPVAGARLVPGSADQPDRLPAPDVWESGC